MLRTLSPRLKADEMAALHAFVATQPPGYRHGGAAETDAGFAAYASEVLRGYLAVWSTAWNLDPGNPALDLSHLLPLADVELSACPVWVVNDLDDVGLPSDAVRLFHCVAPMKEANGFLEKAKRKGLAKAWERTKARLGDGIPPGSNFKKFPPAGEGIWSVRVNDGARAHLRQPASSRAFDGVEDTWVACDIGSHKEMGHG